MIPGMMDAPVPDGNAAGEPTDAELLRQAQSGDDAAFDALARRYAPLLRNLALFLTGQEADAEDVVQETLLGAYEGLARFEARASVKTWLTRILYRQAARHYRSQ